MRSLDKYTSVFVLGMQEAMEYRADAVLGLVSGCFTIFIQFFLWTAIYGGNDSAVLYGFTYPQMVVYIIMAGILTKVTTTDFEYEIADDIREGSLNRFLVQPIAYFPYRVFRFMGRKALHMIIIIAVSAIVLTSVHFTLGAEFAALNILLAFLVTPLALLLNCVMFYCVSAAAFWLTQAWGVFNGMFVVTMVLSGGIFPLDVFGESAQAVFRLLPFQYIVYFPLNIICGNADGGDILFGIAAQLIWIIIMYILSRLLWRTGMKRYIAAGG